MTDVLPDTAAVLAAGGSGRRVGGSVPKQLLDVAGQPIIKWSYEGIVAAGISDIIVVVPEDRVAEVNVLLPDAARVVAGGVTRQASVRTGLEHVRHPRVIVHDAARPFAPPGVFAAVVSALERADAAVPGLRMKETVKLVRDGRVVKTLDREQLWNIQTPQAFKTDQLRDLHARAVRDDVQGTDDAQLVEHYGGTVVVVEGAVSSFKVTDAHDVQRAADYARRRRS